MSDPRPYRPEDHASLVRLWERVFPDDPARNAPERLIQQKRRLQPELLLVAAAGEEIVGAVMAGFDGTRGWIHHLAVDPERRREGIGRRLVEAAERGLRELGCPKVNLQVRAGNEGAEAFYRALGYRTEARVSMGKPLV